MLEVESPDLPARVQRKSRSSAVEETYKAREVEGWLDIRVYRPIGFQLARLCALARLTPSTVSFLGAGIGIVGGHFYLSPDLRLNLVGMALQIVANIFDNADGQLARLTNQGSLAGVVIDGLADHLVFFSIYFHLCLRSVLEGGSNAVWLLAAVAGFSHAVQSMVADYYRAGYLRFVAAKPPVDPDSLREVQDEYRQISWREPGRKLTLRSYLDYVQSQEMLAPELAKLRATVRGVVPPALSQEYRQICEPLLSWGRMLSTNARMFLLFFFLLVRQPLGFFWSEITLLNGLLLFLILRHRRIFQNLLAHWHGHVD